LGFPCNQFGNQEPGSDAEILAFARAKYQVNFPMFSKIEVNGANACSLYQFLTTEKPAKGGATDISWNFEKFLVDGAGNVVERFSPRTTPEEIGAQLSAYLAK
jgi:glutathione peroxidase